MEALIHEVLNILSMNSETLVVAVATGIATAMAFALKHLFALAMKLAQNTATSLDELLVQKVKELFKGKVEKL